MFRTYLFARLPESLDHESRANQQRQGQSHLRNHQQIGAAQKLQARRRNVIRLRQQLVPVKANRIERRRKSEHHSADNGNRQREAQYAAINPCAEPGHGRRRGDQQVDRPPGQQHAGHASQKRQHDALGEH